MSFDSDVEEERGATQETEKKKLENREPSRGPHNTLRERTLETEKKKIKDT